MIDIIVSIYIYMYIPLKSFKITILEKLKRRICPIAHSLGHLGPSRLMIKVACRPDFTVSMLLTQACAASRGCEWCRIKIWAI